MPFTPPPPHTVYPFLFFSFLTLCPFVLFSIQPRFRALFLGCRFSRASIVLRSTWRQPLARAIALRVPGLTHAHVVFARVRGDAFADGGWHVGMHVRSSHQLRRSLHFTHRRRSRQRGELRDRAGLGVRNRDAWARIEEKAQKK